MQDRASNEGRHHFRSPMFNNDLPSLIDGSFNNSLHIFERFFDRGIINENDLNVVIRLFHEKNCPDAANRLEKYIQNSTMKPKSSAQVLTNITSEDGKINIQHGHLFDNDNANTSLLNEREKHTKKSSRQTHLIIYIVLSLVAVCFLISVSGMIYIIFRKTPSDKTKNEETLVIKMGNPFGGPGGEKMDDDAEEATLTFRDNIISVTALETSDENDQLLLLSLTFDYSNGKSGHKYGGINPAKTVQKKNPLNLSPGEHINGITIYEDYRKILNPHRPNNTTYIIVGIHLKTNYDDIGRLFGSTNGTQKSESFDNYFLGYVQGKAGGYIDSLHFTWYRYCLKNSKVFEQI